nr:ATP-binding protein [Iningainema tapete]
MQSYADDLEQRVADRTAALQSANESLETFAYSASHDLLAPLRAMEGLAQALLEDYASQLDSQGQMFAHRIVSSAQRMETLINDLLKYSRLARVDIKLKPVNLAAIVNEVVNQQQCDQKQRQVTVTVEPPFPIVLANYTILVQVLTNLLANAVKFVPSDRHPCVRIYAESGEDSVRLWVEDNGIGIAPEHQERIFQVFERLHGADTYPGTGIGLAIVRKGIERMGGRVGVESHQGKGSRFWIELKIVARQPLS